MTGEDHTPQPKPVIRVCSRSSSLEEDEWAIKTIRASRKDAQNVSLRQFTWFLVIMALLIVVISQIFLSGSIGLAIGVSFVILWVYIFALYIRRRMAGPSVMQGKPLGTVKTLSIPIQRAWQLDASFRPDDWPEWDPSPLGEDFEGLYWLVEVANGMRAVLLAGAHWSPTPFVSGVMPADCCELDYYIYKEDGAIFGMSVRALLAVRLHGIDRESKNRGHQSLGPLRMCYWLNRWDTGPNEDNVYGQIFYGAKDMIADLEHPANADHCTIIREDIRK